MSKFIASISTVAVMIWSLCAQGQAAGNSATQQLAQAAGAKPTVAEMKAAWNGREIKRKTPTGRPLTLKFRPGGKIDMEIERSHDVIYREGKWFVKSDASFCTETPARKRCRQSVKTSDRIFLLDENGKRIGKGVPIKK